MIGMMALYCAVLAHWCRWQLAGGNWCAQVHIRPDSTCMHEEGGKTSVTHRYVDVLRHIVPQRAEVLPRPVHRPCGLQSHQPSKARRHLHMTHIQYCVKAHWNTLCDQCSATGTQRKPPTARPKKGQDEAAPHAPNMDEHAPEYTTRPKDDRMRQRCIVASTSGRGWCTDSTTVTPPAASPARMSTTAAALVLSRPATLELATLKASSHQRQPPCQPGRPPPPPCWYCPGLRHQPL